MIAGLDHKARQPEAKPRPATPQAPQKKTYRIVDGKIKAVALKPVKPPFWDRPKNQNFMNLIVQNDPKKKFFKKILLQKLEHYNKENPHRAEPIPAWLVTPDYYYRIVELEKDKSYQIVDRKDGTVVCDGFKNHKHATWHLFNKLKKPDQNNNP